MHRTIGNMPLILVILFIAVLGSGAMYLLTYILAPDGNIFMQAIYTLALIALGLAVPYGMLKFGMHEAHERNAQEKELHLKDVPKDQQQLKEAGKS